MTEFYHTILKFAITKLSVKFPLANFGISQSHGWKSTEYTENNTKKYKKVYALSLHFVVNNYQCSVHSFIQFITYLQNVYGSMSQEMTSLTAQIKPFLGNLLTKTKT